MAMLRNSNQVDAKNDPNQEEEEGVLHLDQFEERYVEGKIVPPKNQFLNQGDEGFTRILNNAKFDRTKKNEINELFREFKECFNDIYKDVDLTSNDDDPEKDRRVLYRNALP